MHDAIENQRPLETLYLILDILVILSQDPIYAKNTQKINISSPAWYSERSLRTVSLGGLLILLIVRLINLNLNKLQDAHIHIASCGILTNLSATIYNIEPLVSQKLVGLFDLVTKRIQKHADQDDFIMVVFYDIIATLLELFNTMITHSLKDNPQLTYTLLPKYDMIQIYKDYVRFGPLANNITTAIEYFNEKLSDTKVELTVNIILEVIDQAGYAWGPTRIQV